MFGIESDTLASQLGDNSDLFPSLLTAAEPVVQLDPLSDDDSTDHYLI